MVGPLWPALLVRPLDAVIVVAALVMAGVHVLSPVVRFSDEQARSRLLSFAGGVSVSYVFVHLMPELNAAADVVGSETAVVGMIPHQRVHIVALLGFVVFYGLERYVRCSWVDTDAEQPEGIFWFHVGSFAAYNALIGYLLVHRELTGAQGVLWFAVAMGMHFFVNDASLRHHHSDVYRRTGRWVLAATVLVGTAVGFLVDVGEPVLMLLFAFLGGSVVLNAIKEELPEHRDSRFWSFVAGAGGYTGLLVFA
ncbi:hypothetical protein [Halomicrobium salinisoli]|uniref:hypothetical protein n=1 Tax=Halomicrobium salinisoli TaxID=2878391 RepID=UPI001CF0B68B|nr:hypothetical protein [Halomicrobium salinisoli]